MPPRPTASSSSNTPRPRSAKGIRKALTLYAEPELLHRFRQQCYGCRLLLDRTVAEYLKVYLKA